jgi:cell division protein FtsL
VPRVNEFNSKAGSHQSTAYLLIAGFYTDTLTENSESEYKIMADQILTENFLLLFLGVLVIVSCILWTFTLARLRQLRKKFAPILDREAEVARLRADAAKISLDNDVIRKSYGEKRSLLEQLESQLAIYDERLAFAELGLYEPHFDFTDSEAVSGGGKVCHGSGGIIPLRAV